MCEFNTKLAIVDESKRQLKLSPFEKIYYLDGGPLRSPPDDDSYFFFKFDFIFNFVCPLTAMFLSSFYVGTTGQTGSQETGRLKYSFYAKKCSQWNIQKRAKQDLEVPYL